MPVLYGKTLTRREIERRVGTMDQLACVRAITLDDGFGRGTRGFHVSTGGGLDFTVLADRCLDILDFRHNGRSLCWQSGVGPKSPAHYDAEGDNWLYSFFGGMLTTCGLSNAGASSEEGGRKYGLHGRIANTPAERVACGAGWQDDDYILWMSGEMREARVFGPRLVLRRRITTSLGSNSVAIEDIVENEGFTEEPFMLVYHVNAGFPLLDDGARVRIESSVKPLGPFATVRMPERGAAGPPIHGIEEQCFIHDVTPDSEGMAQAEIFNPSLRLGFRIRYRKAELPNLWQWKMMAERDYVMGLEPGNCGPGGRASARAAGELPALAPGESITHRVILQAFTD